MQITPLADKTIKHYGQIRADLQQRGLIIGNNDLWLAADAHAEGWALVTNSEHVFIRVNGLNIENWVVASKSSLDRDAACLANLDPWIGHLRVDQVHQGNWFIDFSGARRIYQKRNNLYVGP